MPPGASPISSGSVASVSVSAPAVAGGGSGLAGSARRAEKPRPVKCQICSGETAPGLDLGNQPVSDLILTERDLNLPETCYPLRLHHCGDCGLTQLSYIVNPKVVYKRFPFVSGTTATATRHLQSL